MARILVIKLSALGDIVQALGPMAAIRRHHKDDHIVLLTTSLYADFLQQSPYADEVWIDDRPRLKNPLGVFSLAKRLRQGKFTRVYDLQTSRRSSRYFHLMRPWPPEWSGIAWGCSHPHANPKRDFMHTLDRQAEQLAVAGIDDTPAPDLSWVKADIERFKLPQRFGLLVPGGAPHRPAKRWPGARFGEMARRWLAQGITPVLLGTRQDQEALDVVRTICPQAVDLSGQTSFADIAVLGRCASIALGNDTGPMHLIVAAGAPSAVLFSSESDPALCAPRGPKAAVLKAQDLAYLDISEVQRGLQKVCGGCFGSIKPD
ncbi:ADP-heptose of LPS heptosyltransferase [Rhodospirillaceae bacterium LM-1]|nr:ADP-heptose of LPS heptosyltransferase [Rhodospirillaceae bacterium LM-1]